MPLSDSFALRIRSLTGNSSEPSEGLRRIVIDTNVLLDLLFWDDPEARPLREAVAAGRLLPIFDDEALCEAAEVLLRTNFLAGNEETVYARLQVWSQNAKKVPNEEIASSSETLTVRCRDPLDQKFLILAVAGRAAFLVTKDKLLFKAAKKLRRFGIEPLRPTDCAAAFANL